MMKTTLIAAFLSLFIMKIKCDDDFIDGLADAYLNDNNRARNNRDRNNHHTVTHKTACETHFW